jgi:uncharacterized protein YxjI
MYKGLPAVFWILFSIASQAQIKNPAPVVSEDHALGTYRLFTTENMWTFLKLNTQDGRIWQVQYDVEGDDRFEVYVNPTHFAIGLDKVPQRFTLYPTQNMYTFILLDQLDGRMWQVQWSLDSDRRGIVGRID